VEKHVEIPNIYHLTYDEARQKLINSGWQPKLNHWSYQDDINIKSGNAPIFWERGYREVESCSGTGYGFCRFIFTDVYLNELAVITGGQEIPEENTHAIVDKWFFLCLQNQ